MIAGREPHGDDILGELLGLTAVHELHDLVVDDAGIRVVHGTVTADEQLRGFLVRYLALEHLTELDVRVDNVRDTLGRVEASNLDDVITGGPLELVHLVLQAQAAELAHVELRVPRRKLLV